MSPTTHEANDPGRHASVVKGNRESLAKNTVNFAESFEEPSGKGAFEMRLYFFSLVRIFVRKFLVHLRTVYASPQKLARPLLNTHFSRQFFA